MFDEDLRVLTAGWSVILDATFLDAQNRAQASAAARDAGVPFQAVWLTAPLAVLEARIGSRHRDASDATVDTLHSQLAQEAGAPEWPTYDASDLAFAARRINEVNR